MKEFLRQRVGLSLFTAEDEDADALPVDLDGLAQWAVGDRLLRDRLAGRPLDRCRQAEWRRGELPPGALGEAVLARVLDDVEPLVAAAQPYLVGRGQATATSTSRCPTAPGSSAPSAACTATCSLRVEFSRLAREAAGAGLGAAARAHRGHPRAVARGHDRARPAAGSPMATAGPLDPDQAAAVLAELVALRRAGLREPLPLPTVAGHAYATVRRGGADRRRRSRRRCASGPPARAPSGPTPRTSGRGARTPARGVLAAPGPPGGEPTRFGTLALRVWSPLLTAEDVVRL